MAVRTEDELSDVARTAVAGYLDSLRATLCAVDRDLAEETLEEVRAHFLERLDPESNEADVAVVAAELGEPDEYSHALCAHVDEHRRTAEGEQGRVLGVPYETRLPTGERVMSRWWDPRDPRILMPRVFGLGWDINYGALAVKLNLIEPDAEDEPFANVPERHLLLALLAPVALTALVLGSYLALRDPLPAELPMHWAWNGVPDRFAPAFSAFLLPFALAVVPTVWAVWLAAAKRSRFAQGGAIALSSLLATLSAGIWGLTAATGMGWTPPAWIFVLVVLAGLLVPFALLTWLARSGRAEEMRRDVHRINS